MKENKAEIIKPPRITVNEIDIFDKHKFANEFNAFFTNIGRKLPSKFQMGQQPSNPI